MIVAILSNSHGDAGMYPTHYIYMYSYFMCISIQCCIGIRQSIATTQ